MGTMYEKYEKLLEEKNVTTYRVCADTGVTRTCISEWKKGRSTPKVDKIQKICDYFDVPITYFYGD